MKKIFFSKIHILLIVFLLLEKNHFRRPKYPSSDRFVSFVTTSILFSLLMILYNKSETGIIYKDTIKHGKKVA